MVQGRWGATSSVFGHPSSQQKRHLSVPSAALQAAVDTATLVMQSGIPVARIELMDELQVLGLLSCLFLTCCSWFCAHRQLAPRSIVQPLRSKQAHNADQSPSAPVYFRPMPSTNTATHSWPLPPPSSLSSMAVQRQ